MIYVCACAYLTVRWIIMTNVRKYISRVVYNPRTGIFSAPRSAVRTGVGKSDPEKSGRELINMYEITLAESLHLLTPRKICNVRYTNRSWNLPTPAYLIPPWRGATFTTPALAMKRKGIYSAWICVYSRKHGFPICGKWRGFRASQYQHSRVHGKT